MTENHCGQPVFLSEIRKGEKKYSAKLTEWVKRYAAKNGEIRSNVYFIKSSFPISSLAGTLFFSDGTEVAKSPLRGNIANTILALGGGAEPANCTVTENFIRLDSFWKDYIRIGLCAIDFEHKFDFDNRYIFEGKLKTCRWCGEQQFLPKNFIVYAIKNVVTKRWYFGSTKNKSERWQAHKKGLDFLTHDNLGMASDARYFGAESFKFMVLFRFNNAEEMFRREQQLINMHWNRQGCYNMATEVVSDPLRRIRTLEVSELVGNNVVSHEFLTLHAAAKHFNVSKTQLKNSIASNNGKIGPYQFPVNISFNEVQFHFRQSKHPSLGRARIYLRQNHIEKILHENNLTLGALSKTIGIDESVLASWEIGISKRTHIERLLGNLLFKHGLNWFYAVPLYPIKLLDLRLMETKYRIKKFEIREILCFKKVPFDRITVGQKTPNKTYEILLCLLNRYGPAAFEDRF
jgi:DNA-binding transcriptional regulator YiaG